MDPGDEAQPDREQLESRVEELEATVSKMLPGRRGVLKGLGAAALGGAAVGGATGGASGQSAAGKIGTASEPVDVEGAQGTFDSVNTDELSNVYDYIVEDSAELADALADAASSTTNSIAIKLGRGTFKPGENISLPVDVSETQVVLHGLFPKLSKTEFPDGYGRTTPEEGSIVDLGGAAALLTGDYIRGSEFKNFYVINGTKGFDFGSTDSMGLYNSEFNHVYGETDDALLHATNIARNQIDCLYNKQCTRVLRITQEHADYNGGNSVFNDVFAHTGEKGDGSGDNPFGGILVEMVKGSAMGGLSFNHPQVNMTQGNADTGVNFVVDAQSGGIVTLDIDGADLEGPTNTAFLGNSMSRSDIEIAVSQAESYDVDLVNINAAPFGNKIAIRNPSATAHSPNGTNTLKGNVKDVSGIWSGHVRHEPRDQYETYVGRSVSNNRVEWGSDTVLNGVGWAFDAEQPQDVTGSRTAGTWYQNTSNFPIRASATFYTNSSGQSADVRWHVNTSESDNRQLRNTTAESSGEYVRTSAAVVVPPGHYYKVEGFDSLQGWQEQKIGSTTD